MTNFTEESSHFLDRVDKIERMLSLSGETLEETLSKLEYEDEFTPWESARFNLLLGEVLYDPEPELLPAEAINRIAIQIVRLVLPNCWEGGNDNAVKPAAMIVLEGFSLRPDLTAEAITTVTAGYLNVAFPEEETSELLGTVDEKVANTILYLMRSKACPVPVAGSLWRTFTYWGTGGWLEVQVTGALLDAATVPVEVVARAHEWWQARIHKGASLNLGGNEGRMDEKFPELADLPLRMKLEVVSTQPVPDEWFLRGLSEPAEATREVPSA